MKKFIVKTKLLSGFLVAIAITGYCLIGNAGNLEPSAGPTISTMKTLDEVEARIPVSPSDMPKTISSSGSYYLTGNFTASSSTFGISIEASNVTFDLNGYTLNGNSAGIHAIQLDADITTTVISNGYIKNWAEMGINSEEAHKTHVKNIHVDSTGSEGLFLADASSVIECSVTDSGVGIRLGEDGIAKRCIARNNSSDGFSVSSSCIVAECIASGNGTDGLEKIKTHNEIEPRIPIPASSSATGVFTISSSGSYYLQGDRSCSGTGIQVDANDVTIDLCGFTMKGPDSGTNYGVYTFERSNVEICNGTVRDFYVGIQGSTLFSANGRDIRIINVRVVSNVNGIDLNCSGSLVKNCTVSDNGVSGIYAAYGSTVIGNNVRSNGDSATSEVRGISVLGGCTVTGNTAYFNGRQAKYKVYGIKAGSGSTVTGNTSSFNGFDAGGTVNGISVSGGTVTGNTVYHNGKSAKGNVYGIFLYGNSLTDQNTSYDNGLLASGTAINMYYAPASVTLGTNHAP